MICFRCHSRYSTINHLFGIHQILFNIAIDFKDPKDRKEAYVYCHPFGGWVHKEDSEVAVFVECMHVWNWWRACLLKALVFSES